MKRAFGSFFLCAVIIGLTIQALLHGDDHHWLYALPPVVVVSYALFLLRIDRRSEGRLHHGATELYFLGYLSTIVALITLTWRGIDSQNLDPFTVLKGAGIALVTTIFGLVGLMTLRSKAESMQIGSPSAADVKTALDENFGTKVSAALDAIGAMGAEAERARENFHGLNQELAGTRSKLGGFRSTVDDGAKSVDEFVRKINTLNSAMEILAKVTLSQNTLDGLNTGIIKFAALGTTADTAKGKFDALNITAGNLNATTGNLNETMSTLNAGAAKLETPLKVGCENIKSYNKAVKELEQVLEDYAAFAAAEIPRLSPSGGNGHAKPRR